MKNTLKTIGLTLAVLSATNVIAGEMTGKQIAEDRKLGNCLACHMIVGSNLPGNIAPPLVAMKSRFSEAGLKAQIWDPRTNNEHSMMPPYGAFKILTPSQVDKVTKYIHSL
jgi:sulfur-oxidizing protein SoxX